MRRLIDFLPVTGKPSPIDPWVKVGTGALIISLLSPIAFHLPGEIPITLQSLVVLVVPMIIGPLWGGLAVLIYLILGFAGLPVFANGSSGLEKLWGPTGGFLIGFLAGGILAGKMAEGRWGIRWYNIALTLLTGHVLILSMGFFWLGYRQGFEGLTNKVYPLLPGLYAKVILGTLLMVLINAIMRIAIRRRYKSPET